MRTKFLRIPTEEDLSVAYDSLLPSAEILAVPELVRYALWSRFDPRLGEIWLTYVHTNWKAYNPIDLRVQILESAWPAVTGVLLDFAKSAHVKDTLFGLWASLVTEGLPKSNNELFFIGLRQLGGKAMFEDAAYSSEEYRKWGFLGRESLINKKQKLVVRPPVRLLMLDALIESNPRNRIRTADYWSLLGKCISKRQAERDLKNHPSLRSVGRTKAKYFVKK